VIQTTNLQQKTPFLPIAKETVIITGATCFIGASVLQLLLQRNYNVRVVVRNIAKQRLGAGLAAAKDNDWCRAGL
jgi:uncharacterized protein YbjT (DUF2867 family)